MGEIAVVGRLRAQPLRVLAVCLVGLLSLWCAKVADAGTGTVLDATFGHGGVVAMHPLPTLANSATSVAAAPAGDIVVGGSAAASTDAPPSAGQGFVVRLQPNGRLDPTFRMGGVVSLPGMSGITEVAPAPDRRLVVLGGSLMRLNANGAPDTTFGAKGVAHVPAGFAATQFRLAPDGAIVLLGTLMAAKGPLVAVVRLAANGRLDPTFGTDGVIEPPQATGPHQEELSEVKPAALTVDRNGSTVLTLVAQGKLTVASTERWPLSIAERLRPDGSPDNAFATHGQVLVAGIGETVGAFPPVIAASGSILIPIMASGGTGAIPGPGIFEISSDGKHTSPPPGLIPEFEPIGPLLAMPDGGYLLTSGFYNLSVRGMNLSYFPKHFDEAAPNPHFENYRQEAVALPAGATDSESLIALQPDGKLVIAGSQPSSGGGQDLMVGRLLGISEPTVGLPPQRITRRDRAIRLRLACSQTQPCRGAITLTSANVAHRLLGRGAFTIGPGRTSLATIRLTGAGIRATGTHPTPAILVLAVENGRPRIARIVVHRR